MEIAAGHVVPSLTSLKKHELGLKFRLDFQVHQVMGS